MVRETEGEAGGIPVVVVDVDAPGRAAEEAFGRAAAVALEALASAGRVRLITSRRIAGDIANPIPRSVLVPAAPLRLNPAIRDSVVTVDAVESTVAGVQRRLAEAVPGPITAEGDLPADAHRIIGDGGGR